MSLLSETTAAEGTGEPLLAAAMMGAAMMGNGAASLGPASTASGSGSYPVVKHFSSYPLPWVEATEWESSSPFRSGLFEPRPPKLSSWDLFEGKVPLDVPPAYAQVSPYTSLFSLPPPRETRLARKLKLLARKKMYQEVRRTLRKQWKSQFQELPSMTYSLYDQRMVQITNIGKDLKELDDLNYEYTTNEVREDLFRANYLGGEREIPLLTFGPLTLTDSGSMRFNPGSVAHAEEVEDPVNVAEEGEERTPFLASKDYRLDTNLKIDLDVSKVYRSGSLLYFVDSYGFTVEITWLSDVLARDMVTAELEFEVNDHREFAGFFNFVIKSRK